MKVSLSRSRAVLIADRWGVVPIGHEGWAPTQELKGHWVSTIREGEQGVHRKVESEELEARFRAVTKCSRWERLEPVSQAEDAEPVGKWRRHILDKSASHGVCGQHGTVSVKRLTRGSLVVSDGNGACGSRSYKGDRKGPAKRCEVAHEPVVVRKRG